MVLSSEDSSVEEKMEMNRFPVAVQEAMTRIERKKCEIVARKLQDDHLKHKYVPASVDGNEEEDVSDIQPSNSTDLETANELIDMEKPMTRQRNNSYSFLRIFDDLNSASKFCGNSPVTMVAVILNYLIGGELYYMPYAVSRLGIGSFVIMLFFVSLLTWFGVVVLLHIGISHNIHDYGELALFSMGKSGTIMVNFAIFIESIVHIVTSILVMVHLVDNWSHTFNWDIGGDGFSYISLIIIIVVILPNCLRRGVCKFSIQSVISMSLKSLILFLLIVMGPIVSKVKVEKRSFFMQIRTIENHLGSLIFAMSYSTCVFQVFKSSKKKYKNTATWNEISGWAVFLGAFVFSMFGIVGYLVFGPSVSRIYIEDFRDPYANIFQILAIAHLSLYIPLRFTVMRHSLLAMLGFVGGENDPWYKAARCLDASFSFILLALIVTIVLMLETFNVISFNENFAVFVNISGSVISSLISFVFPGIIYLILMPRSTLFYYPCIIMIACGLLTVFLIPIYFFNVL